MSAGLTVTKVRPASLKDIEAKGFTREEAYTAKETLKQIDNRFTNQAPQTRQRLPLFGMRSD